MKTLKNIINLFRDTFLLPRVSSSIAKKLAGKYDFAFLIHPRNYEDYLRQYKLLKLLPKKMGEKLISFLGPIIVSPIEGLCGENGKGKKGVLISLLLTPEGLFSDLQKSRANILKATKIASKLGVEIMGLGALTASVTSRGKYIASRVENIGITTGHAFTTVTVIKNLLRVIKKIDCDILESTVAVVGAAGSVGNACTRLLIKQGFKKLILIDKKENLLKKQTTKYPKDVEIQLSYDVNVVYNSDFIITATNAAYALIHSDIVKPGTIILDDTQPSGLDKSLAKREDVICIEAGLVRLKGMNCNFNFGLLHKDDMFACLGETLILSWQDWQGHYVIDYVSDRHLDEVTGLSDKVGFIDADLRWGKRVFTDDDFLRIKNIKSMN